MGPDEVFETLKQGADQESTFSKLSSYYHSLATNSTGRRRKVLLDLATIFDEAAYKFRELEKINE